MGAYCLKGRRHRTGSVLWPSFVELENIIGEIGTSEPNFIYTIKSLSGSAGERTEESWTDRGPARASGEAVVCVWKSCGRARER